MPSLPRVFLHAEAAAVAAVSVAAYAALDGGWTRFALLFLVPDLAILGYLAGPKVGAAAYNVAHTYVGPALLAAVAWWGVPAAWPYVAIWTAHLGIDRALGFGLKYPSGFRDTHLHRA